MKRIANTIFVLLLLSFSRTAPAFAYPAFQRFSEKNSGRTVNCAMCHVNPQGPSGTGYGQLLSLTADELAKVDAARNAAKPGVPVDSPIMNRFGNHIINSLGMDTVNDAIGAPELLAKSLGDKSDLDGDGISDGQEFLQGTDPLDKFNGDPNLLFLINISRYKYELLFVALAIGLITFGLTGFIRSKETK